MGIRDFFRPGWQNSDPQTRLTAVNAIDDFRILKEIVEHDPDETVVLAAIRRIQQETNLAKIVSPGMKPKILQAAIQRIQNENTLLTIISRYSNDLDKYSQFRREILSVITSVDILASLLFSPYKFSMDNWHLCPVAQDICNTKEDIVLFDLIMRMDVWIGIKCCPPDIRVVDVFIASIRDQSLILRIAREHPSDYIRRKIIPRITTLNTLTEIAITGPNPESAVEALAQISKPESIGFLNKVAGSGNNPAVQLTAVRALTRFNTPDSALALVEVLKSSMNIDVALMAIRGLKTVEELPSSFVTIVQEKLPQLRVWLKNEPAFVEVTYRDDSISSSPNERHTELEEAIKWLEKI